MNGLRINYRPAIFGYPITKLLLAQIIALDISTSSCLYHASTGLNIIILQDIFTLKNYPWMQISQSTDFVIYPWMKPVSIHGCWTSTDEWGLPIHGWIIIHGWVRSSNPRIGINPWMSTHYSSTDELSCMDEYSSSIHRWSSIHGWIFKFHPRMNFNVQSNTKKCLRNLRIRIYRINSLSSLMKRT